MSEKFKCSNCGHLVDEVDSKCPNCGLEFDDELEEDVKNVSKNKTVPKYSSISKEDIMNNVEFYLKGAKELTINYIELTILIIILEAILGLMIFKDGGDFKSFYISFIVFSTPIIYMWWNARLKINELKWKAYMLYSINKK